MSKEAIIPSNVRDLWIFCFLECHLPPVLLSHPGRSVAAVTIDRLRIIGLCQTPVLVQVGIAPECEPGRGPAPICANLNSRHTYPASVLVCFNHLAWSLSVAFCKSFCNEIPAFETFTQRQNRIYCASEQIKCKRRFPPQIRLGGIFFTDVRTKIPLTLEYAGVSLIPERRWDFLSLVCAEGIPRGKKNVLARQLQR